MILSRELSLEEIEEIRNQVPDMEIEIFVHGALCMAYSGRCLLSGYINKRVIRTVPAPTPPLGSTTSEEGKEDDVGNIVHKYEPIPVQNVGRRWYRRANRQSVYDRRSPASGRVYDRV